MFIFSASNLSRNVSKHFCNCLHKNKQLQLIEFCRKAQSSHLGQDKVKKSVRFFNIPHSPKDPPQNYHPVCVDHKAFEVPDFISASAFRPFKCPEEILGPTAHKEGCYKNPEYFGYYRYSFVILQCSALKIRKERNQNGAIRCVYRYDEDSDSESEKNNE